MNPTNTLLLILGYVVLLFLVSYFTSRKANADAFYLAGRKAPWLMVSYGMIGVAISGITFVSVPGEVKNSGFTYFQLVLGYALGLILMATILLPIYYKNRSVSIYAYLEKRFGPAAHKTGSGFFLFAHLIGASFRLYLMAYVLQLIVFDALNVPFAVTVFVIIILIWLYTYRGGIKTVIFTDVMQTSFLLLAVVVGIWAVANSLDISLVELKRQILSKDSALIFDWSWRSPNNFFKLFFTGALLTLVNNGLDQAIMQKHLTCSSLWNAQKNVFTLSAILVLVNILFLFLGGALFHYADVMNIGLPDQSDEIYPLFATEYLGTLAGATFVIGIAAAAYSSADTSLTGLTTAFCVDFLGYHTIRKDNPNVRRWVHLGFSLLIFLFILAFKSFNNESVISAFLKVSGYAYGPLLGLFVFGIGTKKDVQDKFVPLVCLIAPIIAYIIDQNSLSWLGYQLNYETIIINALVTLVGLFTLHLLNKSSDTYRDSPV